MNRIEEDDVIPWFKEAALLSYEECESESNDIMLYYDGEFKGMIEVWTDRSHESRMEAGTAEYILLNHTMYYISDFDMNDDLETMAEDMETVVGEKEVVLEDGEVFTVPVNRYGLVPVGIHNHTKKELQDLLTQLKKLEQAQGILRAEAIALRKKLNERTARKIAEEEEEPLAD